MSEEKLSVRLEAMIGPGGRSVRFDNLTSREACDLLREAAQLARRVEEAPVVEVGSYEGTCEVWIDGEHHITRTICAEGIDPPDALAGQRVRLVREG